jgi:flagellar biosynthesis GTPase FlhF
MSQTRLFVSAEQANKRGVAVLILLVATVLGVIVMKSLTSGADEARAEIAGAQATIDLARSRIDGLPADHTLRRQLTQLNQWEAELNGYLTTQERSAETKSRVWDIERAAGQYAEQARRAMEEKAPEDIDAGESDQDKERDESEDEEWEKELEKEREKDEREYEKRMQEKGRERDKERRERWNPFRKLKKLFD